MMNSSTLARPLKDFVVLLRPLVDLIMNSSTYRLDNVNSSSWDELVDLIKLVL